MRRWLLGRWAGLSLVIAVVAVLAAVVVAEYVQNRALQLKATSAEQSLTTTQAGASTISSDLAAAKQEVNSLQSENARLNAQVTALTNQVSTLTSQVASLQAQIPPPPVSCTADPGVRANVNAISLRMVGESTTQALINYLCQNGILTPSAIQNFFNFESLTQLRRDFGYG
jgi:hypothetical protein